MSRIRSQRLRIVTVIAGLLAAAVFVRAQSQTPAPGGQPVHGLRGHYYGAQVGFSYDEYSLPSPRGAPYATRVDSQVAFGRGKGFVKNGGQQAWWPPIPTGGHLGVIWKGFIRLPKAGTYVFATASDDASAVYLNDARVALNGTFGGFLLPDGFVYDDPAAPAHYTNWRSSYLVPVTVEAPRILPIEVRFATSNLGGLGYGIDLYWVTPDAPRDAQGKPVARIVPAEALYVDPPEPVATPAARGANSTISSDFFYLPSDGQTYATLSVRLADRHGRPVAGKRVRVSGLASYGPAPEIVQPDKPTDANGVTTAKVRAQYDSKFFATDVTDFVDVAQVAHLRFVAPAASFLPWTYAPYYDDQRFRVAPLPLAVGRPVTITVPLTNRDKAFPADLTATFLASEPVIGGTGWAEIGKVQGMRLKPGESKEISVTWTPTKVEGHLCFRINLTGRYLPKAAAMPGWFASGERSGWFGSLRSAQEAEGEETPLQSIQHNMGPAARLWDYLKRKAEENDGIPLGPFKVDPKKGRVGTKGEGGGVYVEGQPVAKGSIGIDAGAWGPVVNHAYAQPPEPTPVTTPTPDPPMLLESRQQNVGPVNLTPYGYYGSFDKDYWKGVEERSRNVVAICDEQKTTAAGVGGVVEGVRELKMSKFLIRAGKHLTRKGSIRIGFLAAGICGWAATIAGLGHFIASDPPDPAFQEVYTPYNYELPPPTRSEPVPEAYGAALDAALRNQLEIVSLATSVLVSLERYQGATAAGDRAAAARQFVAYLNYTNQVAQKFEQGAVVIENFVASSRAARIADIVLTVEQVRAAQQQLTSNGFSDDLLALLAWVGVSQEFLDEHILPVALHADPTKAAGSYYAKLLELAAAYRWAGAGLARKAQVTYVVGNPYDREETVDLYIRRVSIPEGWRLAIVDVPEPGKRAAAAAKAKAQPLVREDTPGVRYQLRLPGKGQMRVASVVTPVGPLGENTTARWAVEGYIGNELIGGMMHEMHVPAILPDLKLPPIGGTTPAPWGGAQWWLWAAVSAGVLLALSLFLLFLARSRRRRAASAPGAGD